MVWVYRNVIVNRVPPCPACGSVDVEPPQRANSKYQCRIEACRAWFQATWKPDTEATGAQDGAGRA